MSNHLSTKLSGGFLTNDMMITQKYIGTVMQYPDLEIYRHCYAVSGMDV